MEEKESGTVEKTWVLDLGLSPSATISQRGHPERFNFQVFEPQFLFLSNIDDSAHKMRIPHPHMVHM